MEIARRNDFLRDQVRSRNLSRCDEDCGALDDLNPPTIGQPLLERRHCMRWRFIVKLSDNDFSLNERNVGWITDESN